MFRPPAQRSSIADAMGEVHTNSSQYSGPQGVSLVASPRDAPGRVEYITPRAHLSPRDNSLDDQQLSPHNCYLKEAQLTSSLPHSPIAEEGFGIDPSGPQTEKKTDPLNKGKPLKLIGDAVFYAPF